MALLVNCRQASCIWNKLYNFLKVNYEEDVADWVGVILKVSYAINQNLHRFPGPIPRQYGQFPAILRNMDALDV